MVEGNNGCKCMLCRRREFGELYWMNQYTDIIENIKVFLMLTIENGFKVGSLSDEGIGGTLASLQYNIDGALELLAEEEELGGLTFRAFLDKWELTKEFDKQVKSYNDYFGDKKDESQNTELKNIKLQNVKLVMRNGCKEVGIEFIENEAYESFLERYTISLLGKIENE
ncbi:MAG: hypothetical protein HUJ68_12510 [Clostridia bacterium]|nr:hypothetical protein [Clostridia bacterium]